MADITKCLGYDCEFKESCYRFKAKDTLNYQSYFTEKPPLKKDGLCDYFWPVPVYKKAKYVKKIGKINNKK